MTLTRAAFVRRLALAGLSATVLGDSLSACSRTTFAPSGSTLPATPTPSPSGAVQLLAPPGVVDPIVLRAFSQRTGVSVRSAPGDDTSVLETLRGGTSCDVVLVPDDLVTVLAGERLLLPLDMRLVGNFDYVQGAFRAPPYDHGDPARYSVPFQFETLGLAMRPGALGGAPPCTWADLWQPRLRGGVRVDARGRSVIGIGLLSLGFPLGSTDRRQIDLAVARLIALGTNLREPGPDRGGAPVTVCWSPRALRAAGSAPGSGMRFVLPADGFEIDTHVLCVARATANRLAAHAFLDFCLRPGVQRGIAERLGTQSAEPEAWQYLPPLERSFARSDLQLVHGQWLGDLSSFGAIYDGAWETVARAWGLVA